MLAGLALSQLLQNCAPNIGARTMTAIISVESAGNPLAIYDNTLRRSFAPRDTRQAVAWANQLLSMHHSVDLGLSQINNANLPRLGLRVSDVFEPCANVSGGSLILALNYRAAAQRFGPGQSALRHAIGAYNSGSLFAGDTYVAKILAAAGLGTSRAIEVPDLQEMPSVLRLASDTPKRVAASDAPVVLRRIRPVHTGLNPASAPILVTTSLPSFGDAASSAGVRMPTSSVTVKMVRNNPVVQRSAIMLRVPQLATPPF